MWERLCSTIRTDHARCFNQLWPEDENSKHCKEQEYSRGHEGNPYAIHESQSDRHGCVPNASSAMSRCPPTGQAYKQAYKAGKEFQAAAEAVRGLTRQRGAPPSAHSARDPVFKLWSIADS